MPIKPPVRPVTRLAVARGAPVRSGALASVERTREAAMKRALLVVLAIGPSVTPSSASTDAYIELCLPPIAAVVQQANTSFPVVASFVIDAQGRPADVSIQKGAAEGWPPIDAEWLSACVRSWRLGGVATGSRFQATWQWVHGVGWTNLLIEGPGLKHRILINGDHCYYCPRAGTPSNYRLDPTVGPITGLACARPAPVPPAG